LSEYGSIYPSTKIQQDIPTYDVCDKFTLSKRENELEQVLKILQKLG